MKQRTCNRHGQNTAEYAIVIAIVLGAVIGMQTFVRRALNAKVADASDGILPDTRLLGIADDGTAGATATFPAARNYQFEPDYTSSVFTTETKLGSPTNVKTVPLATVKLSDVGTGVSKVEADFGSWTTRDGTQTEVGATGN